ncbi:MAG TPA: ParA family protein [Thermoanaerobaculia bacterium]|nr:ParA family protein [Thermoanaerobaculia bacterium]
MRILAIANHKGGVGKTTTAVNLAACLAALDRQVLLIDCDPQGSASRWLGFAREPTEPTDPTDPTVPTPPRLFLEDVFSGKANLAAATHPTAIDRLALVPASPELAVQDRLLAGKPAPAAVLARALQPTRSLPFDYILLDSPPQLGLLSCNVLAAADELLIPLSPDPLSVAVLDELLQSVATIREWLNPRLRIAGILLVRVRAQTLLARQVAAELAARYGDLILPVQIRETVRAAEAPSRHLPLIAASPDASAAEDYRQLAQLLLANRHSHDHDRDRRSPAEELALHP